MAAATTRDFAIITTDEQGHRSPAGTRAPQRIFGYAEAEMLGQPIAVDLHARRPGPRRARAGDAHAPRETGRAEDERWHRRKDGSRFYCSGVMTPHRWRRRQRLRQDRARHDRHQAARNWRRSTSCIKEKKASVTAQAANELKDKFLAVMSHELKQPLNLIQMNAELLTRLPVAATMPVGAAHRRHHQAGGRQPGAHHQRPARPVAHPHRQAAAEPRRGGRWSRWRRTIAAAADVASIQQEARARDSLPSDGSCSLLSATACGWSRSSGTC